MRKMENPVFSQINTGTTHYEDVDAASYKGIMFKTCFLLLVTIAVAALTAYFLPIMLVNQPAGLYVALVVASIVSFIAAMVGRISARKAKYAGVIYAAGEGLLLGTTTGIIEMLLPGENIAVLAVFSTVVIFAVMLILYATGVLRNGTFFRKLAYAMSFGAIALILFSFIFNLIMPITSLPVLIAIEAFFLIYGAVTLIFSFDEATAVVQAGCTKEAEWSVSLGLSICLIFIYIEALRLIFYIVASSKD